MEEEEKQKEESEKKAGGLSRREFFKDAGLVVGGVAASALVSCTPAAPATQAPAAATKVAPAGGATPAPGPDTGAVEPAFEKEESILMKLGGNNSEHTMVDVKNGKIVRIRPLHYDERYTKEELAPTMWKWTGKNGSTFEPLTKSLPSYMQLTYKKRIYSPNRILYPLKRVDWEPGGDPAKINPQNRGVSKYKRISWDEATNIIASEVKRIQDKFGAFAVLSANNSAHREGKNVAGGAGTMERWLNFGAGSTKGIRNADSWEGHYWGAKHVWGCEPNNGNWYPQDNMANEIAQNCEMLVFQGCDWETTQQSAGQHAGRVLRWWQEQGIKFVHVAPDLNYLNAAHPDKWIPILPNTDSALYMGMIHTWLKEDTWDKTYVASHVVGMDKIQDYVLGKADGVEKTPAWAAQKCGVPEWTIKALAREWAKKKTSKAVGNGGSMIRGPYAHEPSRWECIILGMQGLGAPGRQQVKAPGTPRRKPNASATVAMTAPPENKTIKQLIPKTLIQHAILNGKATSMGRTDIGKPAADQFVKYTYPIPAADGGAEIHAIYQDHACQMQCWNDGFQHLHAIRSPKIEFYAIQHIWMENDCLTADIVLPINTMAEEEDLLTQGKEMPALVYTKGAIPSIGESKCDWDAGGEIAKKLEKYGGVYADLYKKYTDGKTYAERIKAGYDSSGLTQLISFDKLKEKGYYIPPVDPTWVNDKPGGRAFYEDPVKNALTTPTGKMEFFSQKIADNFPDDKERPAYPQWVVGGPASQGWTHDESLWGERAKKYPMLLVSNHPRYRCHVQYDDVPWLREIETCKVKGPDGYMYESAWINPKDAEKKGIKDGDIVKIFNDRGITLGGARLSHRIIPGAVYQDHGAKFDPIGCEDVDFAQRETKWVNRGSDNNVICPSMGTSKNCWGLATSGYLVEVAKVGGDEYEAWRKKYPEVWARSLDPDRYDPAYGLKFGAFVVRGGTV